MTGERIELPASHASAPMRGSDRSFGIVFAGVFCVIGVLPYFTAGYVRAWALVLSAAFLLTAAVKPRLLDPLNRLWAHVGLILNRIVSPIALLIVYCVAVVPTAIVLRLLRKDLLHLRTEAEASSYWVVRAPSGRPDAGMKKQF